MGSDWFRTTVGSFCPFSYGKRLPENKRNSNGTFKVYGSNGLVGLHDQPLVDEPGIVIGRKGTVGAVHFASEPFWPIDTTFYVVSSSDRHLRYTYYLLKSLGLENMNTDSAVPGLNRNAAHAKQILVPPYDEQCAIAHILGSLDDKIELNRQMNKTLEATARAIFKSWFVDFDPVRAKAEGRPTGLPDDIAALFPDSFENSELGEIPKGWKIVTFEELIDAKQGKYIPKNKMTDLPSSEYAYPVWGGNGIRGYAATFMYKQPVVVLTCRGSNCGRIDLTESPAWVSNIAFACSSKYGSVNFINVYLVYSSLTDTITGSAQPQITYTSLRNKRMQFPVHEEVCDAYSDYIDRLYDMIRGNNRQSTTLASLRDTLLPKLISGELRIPDAEKFIEEAGL